MCDICVSAAVSDVGVMSLLRSGHLVHFCFIMAGGKTFDFHPLGHCLLLSQIVRREESLGATKVTLKFVYGQTKCSSDS